MGTLVRYGLVGLIVLSPGLARAACPDDAAVAAFVADFKAARVSKGISNDLSMADAQCYQRKVVKALEGDVLGKRIGYKAAFSHPDVMKRMKVTEPSWAVMLDKSILLNNGQEKQLGSAHGDALMGHPLNVVMWMAKNIKKDGVTLKPGELLDLGGYLVPGPMQPGSTVRVKYVGFPGEPTLTVKFQ